MPVRLNRDLTAADAGLVADLLRGTSTHEHGQPAPVALRAWAHIGDPDGLSELGITANLVWTLPESWVVEIARFGNDPRARTARVVLEVLDGGATPKDLAVLQVLAARPDVPANPEHARTLLSTGNLTIYELLLSNPAVPSDVRVAAAAGAIAHATDAYGTVTYKTSTPAKRHIWRSSLCAEVSAYIATQVTALITADATFALDLVTNPARHLNRALLRLITTAGRDHQLSSDPAELVLAAVTEHIFTALAGRDPLEVWDSFYHRSPAGLGAALDGAVADWVLHRHPPDPHTAEIIHGPTHTEDWFEAIDVRQRRLLDLVRALGLVRDADAVNRLAARLREADTASVAYTILAEPARNPDRIDKAVVGHLARHGDAVTVGLLVERIAHRLQHRHQHSAERSCADRWARRATENPAVTNDQLAVLARAGSNAARDLLEQRRLAAAEAARRDDTGSGTVDLLIATLDDAGPIPNAVTAQLATDPAIVGLLSREMRSAVGVKAIERVVAVIFAVRAHLNTHGEVCDTAAFDDALLAVDVRAYIHRTPVHGLRPWAGHVTAAVQRRLGDDEEAWLRFAAAARSARAGTAVAACLAVPSDA